MRSFTCLLGLVSVLLVGAWAGSEAPAADGPAAASPPYCRLDVDVVFWGARQWLQLGEALANDYSRCAEYYISIPPRDDDRTVLRGRGQFDAMRALHPRVHPVAEIRWTSDTGWRAWVIRNGQTFYEGGVTARRRMAARGLDSAAGETWAFNELTPEVLDGAPGARAEILEFMRGLYDGAPGMPKARGIVFNVWLPSDSGRAEVAAYKESLQAWLTDEPFWNELDSYVNFFANEVYVSARNWGVSGAPLARRAEHLNDYFHHMTALAEAGPESAEAARGFLRRTSLPLANAAWPSELIGGTDVLSAETMAHFVSTQVYAIRHYANSHPRTGPQGRLGFAWAPLTEIDGYSEEGRDLLRARLASAIHESSEEGTNSQMGACGPPGEHVWCEGEVAGAEFADVWKTFSDWD
jgi:hypothetical protein